MSTFDKAHLLHSFDGVPSITFFGLGRFAEQPFALIKADAANNAVRDYVINERLFQ